MSADEKACPRCAETIKVAAKMCRFCQLDLDPAATKNVKASDRVASGLPPARPRGMVKVIYAIGLVLGVLLGAIGIMGTVWSLVGMGGSSARDFAGVDLGAVIVFLLGCVIAYRCKAALRP